MRQCDLWLHLGGTVVDPATCSDLVVLKLILIIEVHERYYLVAANWKYFYTRSCSQDEVMCTTALIRIGQRNLACRCGMVNSLGEANTQWDLELVVVMELLFCASGPTVAVWGELTLWRMQRDSWLSWLKSWWGEKLQAHLCTTVGWCIATHR